MPDTSTDDVKGYPPECSPEVQIILARVHDRMLGFRGPADATMLTEVADALRVSDTALTRLQAATPARKDLREAAVPADITDLLAEAEQHGAAPISVRQMRAIAAALSRLDAVPADVAGLVDKLRRRHGFCSLDVVAIDRLESLAAENVRLKAEAESQAREIAELMAKRNEQDAQWQTGNHMIAESLDGWDSQVISWLESIAKDALSLCHLVETMPASVQQTDVSIAASKLRGRLATTAENFKKRVAEEKADGALSELDARADLDALAKLSSTTNEAADEVTGPGEAS